MDVVVDANILFSVLIKDGGTAKVMFRDELHKISQNATTFRWRMNGDSISTFTDPPPL